MTTPTSRLFPSRHAQLIDWLRRSDPWHVLSLLIVVVVLVGVWFVRPDAPPSVGRATPAPVILVATPLPATPVPIVASSAELRLLRAVVAYAAPDGELLGATLPGRPYELLARSGAAWLLLAIDGSGSVWVRRQDLEGVVDIATPVSTERPIAIASEQRRTAPTALAATVAPTTPTEAPPAPVPMLPRTITWMGRSSRPTPASRMAIGATVSRCICIPSAASRCIVYRPQHLSVYLPRGPVMAYEGGKTIANWTRGW